MNDREFIENMANAALTLTPDGLGHDIPTTPEMRLLAAVQLGWIERGPIDLIWSRPGWPTAISEGVHAFPHAITWIAAALRWHTPGVIWTAPRQIFFTDHWQFGNAGPRPPATLRRMRQAPTPFCPHRMDLRPCGDCAADKEEAEYMRWRDRRLIRLGSAEAAGEDLYALWLKTRADSAA